MNILYITSPKNRKMKSVLTTKTLTIENTEITPPKLDKNKKLSAGIFNTQTKSAVYIETPYLINPFGVSCYEPTGGKAAGDDTRTWSLSLKMQGNNPESQEDVATLNKYFKDLDEKTIDYLIANSKTLFKKEYTESQRQIVVDLLYNRCIKPSTGPDGTVYPDKVTLKIMKNEASLPDLLVFKDSPQPIQLNSWEDLQGMVPKGMAIKAILQPRFYFVNGKAGVNFRLMQIKLPNVERVGKPTVYAFSDTFDASASVPVAPAASAASSTEEEAAADSEEEVEEEVVEEEEEEEETA